jgi:lysophospholipase L1-like esterase
MTRQAPRRRLPAALAALAAVAGLAVAPSAQALIGAEPDMTADDEAPRTYVALGDSYAAGPLIPLFDEPWGCLKSTNNYPKLMAQSLGLEIDDATCSGAQTRHMTQEQGVWPQPNPPQFDRLHAGVDIVSLQIGGNDIGFSGIADACVEAGIEGSSCRDQYVDDETGRDELRERIERTAPRVAAVLEGIAERAPDAEIFVLGYPGIFSMTPDAASCPAMGVGEDDARYLRGVQEALNAMIAEQAEAHGAVYVDVYGPSEGKTACDLPVIRWVEPLVPVNAAAPIHPNIMGMLQMADVLAEAVAAPGQPGGDDPEEERGRGSGRPTTPPGREDNPGNRP